MSDVQAIKARADLLSVLELLGARMSLGHSWDDETYVWCPFCDDASSKKPAGRANSLKGLYFCFSCGIGGDVIKIVGYYLDTPNRVEKPSFTEIIAWLEERFPEEENDPPWMT